MEHEPANPSPHRATDIGIRILGMVLGGAGIGAGYALTHDRAEQASHGARAGLLAALLFLGLTFGAMLFCLGRHMFDRVAVRDRWRRDAPSAPPRRAR